MQSEFYHLRRTSIKDVFGYLGFLIGFLGAAPFAWRFLSDEVDRGGIVRGLSYFFGLVSIAGVIGGTLGLAIGFGIGWSWERYHRWRRPRPADYEAPPSLIEEEFPPLRRIK